MLHRQQSPVQCAVSLLTSLESGENHDKFGINGDTRVGLTNTASIVVSLREHSRDCCFQCRDFGFNLIQIQVSYELMQLWLKLITAFASLNSHKISQGRINKPSEIF